MQHLKGQRTLYLNSGPKSVPQMRAPLLFLTQFRPWAQDEMAHSALLDAVDHFSFLIVDPAIALTKRVELKARLVHATILRG